VRHESKLKFYSRLAILPVLFALVVLGSFASASREAEAQIPGDLAVTKSTATSIGPGGTLTYTVTISNVGMGPREFINFSDTLPTNTTYVAGSWTQVSGPPFVLATNGPPVTQVSASRILMLNGGESAVFTFQVTVPLTATNGTTIVNTCVVSTTSTAFNETNLANNTCVFTTVVVVAPTPTPVPPTVTPVPNTPVPPTPVPPTLTPIVLPPVVIPQVIQNPAVGGIFNGTRNNTPTPVRPSAAAAVAVDPGAVPVLRPPSTGDAGLADNAASNAVYGLAIIAALGVVSFGAARLRTVRQK
jgi:uncharacterized repeat protein (TIGR01451 family)